MALNGVLTVAYGRAGMAGRALAPGHFWRAKKKLYRLARYKNEDH